MGGVNALDRHVEIRAAQHAFNHCAAIVRFRHHLIRRVAIHTGGHGPCPAFRSSPRNAGIFNHIGIAIRTQRNGNNPAAVTTNPCRGINPDDDTAFARVVNFPTRGIGARSVEALQEAAHRANSSLYNAAASLGGKPGAAVGNFVRLIETLRTDCAPLSLPEKIELILEHSGLRAHYLGEKEGQERLENLDELINAGVAFQQEAIDNPGDMPLADDELAAFLAHAALEAGEHQAGEGQDAVQMMTVHAAKGLEFDVVFITGLEHGLFPHENATQERDGVEEERRLMYVAVTRARKRLYLSHAQTRMLHGQTRYCVPSQFLEELPEELLRKIGNTTAFASPGAYSGGGAKSYSGGYVPAPAPASTMTRSAAAGAAESAIPGGLRIGQNVEHAKFGAGVIVGAEGRGNEARVQVNFRVHGVKWLALQYAKLTPV